FGSVSSSQMTQAIVLFIISWVVTLVLGGLHYLLVHRDLASDPGAGGGAVRALFLNGGEAIAALVAISAGVAMFASLGQQYSRISTSLGILIAFLLVFALFEFERRRTQVHPGGALTLQRLHLYGMHLVLLFFFITSAALVAISSTLEV